MGASLIHLPHVPNWVLLAFFGAVFLATIWKGGWRERLVSGLGLATLLINLYFCRYWVCVAQDFRMHVAYGIVVDLVLLAACVAGAVRGRRYWILWATSFALLTVCIDILVLVVPGFSRWAYAWGQDMLGEATSLAVLWSVYQSARKDWARKAANRV